MRRPKRHQSKSQLRCEHHKKRAQWLEQVYCESKLDIVALKRKLDLLVSKLERVEAREERAQRIIERASTIDFNRCENGYYQISVRFNGDFMGGISRYGEDLRYIAQHVARQIEHEIASSKFVETAKMNERRQYMANVRRAYQGGEWIDGE